MIKKHICAHCKKPTDPTRGGDYITQDGKRYHSHCAIKAGKITVTA